MEVNYVIHMGDDLSIVNAAKVSFNKASEWQRHPDFSLPFLADADTKLIKYLAKHNHWTPFGHTAITLHMKLPMFVQRQMDKHQIGFVVNEVSRRYVDDTPEFYEPRKWRARPDASIKQGSGGTHDMLAEIQDDIGGLPVPVDMADWYQDHLSSAEELYTLMVESGVAPEMARMVLPMSLYTESWKTGSLAAWARVFNLRIDGHAQKETQEMAKMIDKIVAPLFPVGWEALTNGNT